MADSAVNVPYGGTKVVTLYVQPVDAAVGKTIYAESASPMLATIAQNEAVIDRNGMAQFEIRGELPGTTAIAFNISGVKTKARVIANIGDFSQPAVGEPKASLVSGTSVYRGTKVELTADSKELKIWYTKDGTCPCDENGTRKVYTEPLTINSDVTIKAIAENSAGEASDVVTFVYSILQSKSGVELEKGWTWVSFNMKNDALESTNNALASGIWTSDDVVKDNRYVDVYSSGQKKWIGTMSKHGGLGNTGMYKIRSSRQQILGLTGEAVNPMETAIPVEPGWNYISYVPLTGMSVTDALCGYDAQNGDVIKSQDAFATYSATNGWEGSLTVLTAGKGYMLKRSASAPRTSFSYPVVLSGTLKGIVNSPSKCHRYGDNMNLVGEVCGVTVEDGDSLIAYVDGEIRGASRLDRRNKNKVYLTIHGDDDASVALVLQREGEIIATASTMIDYRSNKVVGTGDNPTAIMFITENHTANGITGNIKAVYNVNGVKMRTRRLDDVPYGTYIVYYVTGGQLQVTKYIKQ